jgi:hypothetical protein
VDDGNNFLTFEDGVKLETIDFANGETPEYFTFDVSSSTNVEDITSEVFLTSASTAKYRIETDNAESIYKIDVNAKGHYKYDPNKTYETG